jgi:hypothetical protein
MLSRRWFLAASVIQGAVAQDAAVKRILIAYHSESGNTEKLAQAIRKGASAVPGAGRDAKENSRRSGR